MGDRKVEVGNVEDRNGNVDNDDNNDDDLVLIPKSGYQQTATTSHVKTTGHQQRQGKFHRTQFLHTNYHGEPFILPKAWILPSPADPKSGNRGSCDPLLSEGVVSTDAAESKKKDPSAEAQANANEEEIKVNDRNHIPFDAGSRASLCGLTAGEEVFTIPDPHPISEQKEQDRGDKDGRKNDSDDDKNGSKGGSKRDEDDRPQSSRYERGLSRGRK